MLKTIKSIFGVNRKFKPNFGNLRTLHPISTQFGYERGNPIDRYYIENFLELQSEHIQGKVIEIGDNSYTQRFASSPLELSDVIHISDTSATYVTDLATDTILPENYYDCAIITQTLQFIHDCKSALSNIHKTLKPNGVLLVTVPGISQLSNDQWADTWCWAFTKYSLLKMAADIGFKRQNCKILSHGNVLTSSAFLYGLAAEDLTQTELDYVDDRFQQVITLVARKSEN